LQANVLFVCTHPLAGLHESSVQGLLSLQPSAGPPTQDPPLHVSAVVHALPSLQATVLFVCTQPVAGLHESSVHGLLSLQPSAGPPTQDPPLQVSAVVHALPSLQANVLFVCTHPLAGLHESSVQGLLSLQPSAGPPTQDPPEHVSTVVHAFPSLHAAVLFACTHPLAGLHESSVHGFPSSQLSGDAPTQDPLEHVSTVVQAFPSLHAAVLFVCTQPAAGLQESSVQGFPSSQFSGDAPTQDPLEHVSTVVQAFPSLQATVLFVCTQPVAGLQESSVQGLLSSQPSAGPPTQDPPEHVSTVVHAFPSLHAAVLFA
jgi:glyoxylate utilization-related uncharacterized protein